MRALYGRTRLLSDPSEMMVQWDRTVTFRARAVGGKSETPQVEGDFASVDWDAESVPVSYSLEWALRALRNPKKSRSHALARDVVAHVRKAGFTVHVPKMRRLRSRPHPLPRTRTGRQSRRVVRVARRRRGSRARPRRSADDDEADPARRAVARLADVPSRRLPHASNLTAPSREGGAGGSRAT
jgi:hypothetical protein